jgi:hypothetical protein
MLTRVGRQAFVACFDFSRYKSTQNRDRTARNRLRAVRSDFLPFEKIYEPVAVPVQAQNGKKPDRTGP